MSNVKKLKLNDIATFTRGKIISKSDIDKNKGDYPVFSTQVEDAFGYINTFMYDGDYLIWNTDGLAGYIKHVSGKFSITNIVGIILLKENNLDLDYLKFILEPIFRKNKKGRVGENGKNEYTKLTSTMVKKLDIEIEVPIKEDGTYDLEAQKEIATKYKDVESQKQVLFEKKEKLKNITVDIINNFNSKKVKLNDLFLNKRGNSKYTKDYCNKNIGEFEVYTGTTIGSFAKINTFEYNTPNLTYTTDGENAGTLLFIKDEKYNIGGHRAILTPKAKELDLTYFQYILKPIFKNNVKKGSVPSLTWNKIKDIEIEVPIKEDGIFDLEAQKEIATKYRKMEEFKKALIKQIDNLLEIELEL